MLYSHTIKLVRFYEGADGLKTGHTDAAKYCMAVTAKKSDMRLLAVVLGEETAAIRNQETSSLLDYGFNNYKLEVLKNKTETLDEVKLDKADKPKVSIVLTQDITTLLKRNETKEEYDYELNLNEISPPLKKGNSVGKLLLKQKDKVVCEFDVTVGEDINKIGILKIWGNLIKSIITGVN